MPTNTALRHYRIRTPIASLHAEPHAASMCTSEALYGEHVSILSEENATWVQVRQAHDGYEGYINRAELQVIPVDKLTSPTHWVTQRNTLLFSEASFKSQVIHRIPFGAALSIQEGTEGPFSPTACGHFVWSEHMLPLNKAHSADPLTLARSHFLGCVYRWGGRSPAGADCSGLIQMLARSQNLSIPRDSGDQEAFLTIDVNPNDLQPLDLIYWPGHTGILASPTHILHATAFTLSCVIEPLQDVISRAGPVRSVKRLFN